MGRVLNEEQKQRKAEYEKQRQIRLRSEFPDLIREKDRIKAREQRQRHGERIRARDRSRYLKNREHIRAREKLAYEQNFNGRRDKALTYHREKYAKRLLEHRIAAAIRAAKSRAKSRGLDFDLVPSVLGMPTHCAVTGIEFDMTSFRQGNIFVPSLDRIDPDKGYVMGNVRFVCHGYNLAKHTGPDSQVLKLARALVAKFGME